ncbi:hypothetical protein [Devosia nitrariae]|uniref:CoxF protein n=1 Tax=Devosia nitrariae TaxID=2071872 RepID=A0ABQ5VZ97_9HYPH|nr:hypothetical protein [Devosia nitrariae]GLQ52924.1 hypothetical protein GCM10010862_01820 [Devosia nitrariae]
MAPPRPQAPEPADEAELRRKKAQRRRSIALALALAGFALIFYILTIAKMGPALFERAL